MENVHITQGKNSHKFSINFEILYKKIPRESFPTGTMKPCGPAYSNTSKTFELHFRSFSRFKIDVIFTWFFLEMPPLFYVRKLWNTPFSIWFWNWGISRFLNINDISGLKHVTCFSNKNGPKMKFIDFWSFRGKCEFHNMLKSTFICFLGHFMVPPVLVRRSQSVLWKPYLHRITAYGALEID